MALEFSITYGAPSEEFWEHFTQLWQNSPDRPPFESPRLLRFFSTQATGQLACFQCWQNGELCGAVILKGHKGVYTFLSDLKTDVNFFVFHNEVTPEVKRQFFEFILQTAKGNRWSLALNNQPAWAEYMPQLEQAAKAEGVYWQNIAYSVCPVVAFATPEELYKHIHSSRELRYRVNKLVNQKNGEFEILTDNSDLEHWVKEFCDAHVLRWSTTNTPSAYRSPKRREFLLGCLKSWAEEGILVRFSVKVEGARVGFVVGLLENNSLVHHSTTYHPAYSKFSPGKALIHVMAEWMKTRNLSVLDFGDGNEPYKYTVANDEHQLNRIFISTKTNLPFILKTRLIKWTKEHPKIYEYYSIRIKPLITMALGFREPKVA